MSRPLNAREKRFKKIIADGEKEFGNHVATVIGTIGEGLYGIRWAKPGCSNFWMDIVILSGTVFIRGDLGEATYVWSSPVSPEFLIGTNLGYFHSKCMASEKGSIPKDWNEDVALEWLDEQRRQRPEEDPDCDMATFDELAEELRKVAHDRREWEHFVSQHYGDEIQDVFGVDAWEFIWDPGAVPMSRCILHWLGIRLALQSLGYGKGGQ